MSNRVTYVQIHDMCFRLNILFIKLCRMHNDCNVYEQLAVKDPQMHRKHSLCMTNALFNQQ